MLRMYAPNRRVASPVRLFWYVCLNDKYFQIGPIRLLGKSVSACPLCVVPGLATRTTRAAEDSQSTEWNFFQVNSSLDSISPASDELLLFSDREQGAGQAG